MFVPKPISLNKTRVRKAESFCPYNVPGPEGPPAKAYSTIDITNEPDDHSYYLRPFLTGIRPMLPWSGTREITLSIHEGAVNLCSIMMFFESVPAMLSFLEPNTTRHRSRKALPLSSERLPSIAMVYCK